MTTAAAVTGLALAIEGEDRYGFNFALVAYVVLFAAFFGYLAWLHVAQRRIARRLDSLERDVAARRGTSSR
jgi:hypothetical protein